MTIYYAIACHDCKTRTAWKKWAKEYAYDELPKLYHAGHDTEVGPDESDDYYVRVAAYKVKERGFIGD